MSMKRRTLQFSQYRDRNWNRWKTLIKNKQTKTSMLNQYWLLIDLPKLQKLYSWKLMSVFFTWCCKGQRGGGSSCNKYWLSYFYMPRTAKAERMVNQTSKFSVVTKLTFWWVKINKQRRKMLAKAGCSTKNLGGQ